MDEAIAANLSELVEFLLATAGAGAFSALGAHLESLALGAFSGGQLSIAAWFGVAGLLALYVGLYALGVSEVIPRVRRLVRSPAQQ